MSSAAMLSVAPLCSRCAEYLAFYRQVVTEARQRGIKVMPHVSVVFADTPFSPMKGIYRGLTLERFKAEYRDMVMLIARELKPDYLDLLTEPDTHARLTGLRELNQPKVIADIVENALRGWDHAGILCGAGTGSWSPAEFARALVKIRELDYLAIHVYPINPKFLDNAREMARIARVAGKQAIIDESWLYKTERRPEWEVAPRVSPCSLVVLVPPLLQSCPAMTPTPTRSRLPRGFVTSLFAVAAAALGHAAQPAVRDYTSKVPQYKFSSTLEAQEAELRTNPLLARMNASRQKQADDPHRPIYHYVNPEGNLNDPNGLCFWQGRWHLFYQAYPPEDPRQHWGHAVSTDLIHWRDLPLAIYPNPEDKVFSGSTLVESDRVIAIYHGVAAGTMVAVSRDPLLLNWEKITGHAVIPYPKPGAPPLPYNIFDPCLWKQGEFYYALTAGTSPKGPGRKPVRANFLHRSRDLAKWEYLHEFIDGYDFSQVGDDGACPYFWPIGNRHIMLHFSHVSGGKYLLGDYDTARQKFVVTQGGNFNHGPVNPSGVHAPSAVPDGKGGVIAIFNMNPGRPTKGWNQIMTLPQRLTLIGPDQLGIEPAGDIASLRQGHRQVGPLTLPANQEVVLETISGQALELAAEIDLQDASMLELNVLRSPGREEHTRIVFYGGRGFNTRPPAKNGRATRFAIDSSYSSLLRDVRPRAPETADVFLPTGEPLKLRIFVDRSVVEVFANGRQYAAVRVYPSRSDSVGVSLRSQGSDTRVRSLEAWQMKNIYAESR